MNDLWSELPPVRLLGTNGGDFTFAGLNNNGNNITIETQQGMEGVHGRPAN